MKAGYVGPMALALALALGGCGDDDSSQSTKTDPFANAAGSAANMTSGVDRGAAGRTDSTSGSTAGTSSDSSSTAGTGASPELPGDMKDGGAMPPPMMEGMKPPKPGMMPGAPEMMPGMMEVKPPLVCPDAAPMNDTPCTEGPGMCTFDTLKCRCKKEGWSCEANTMPPPPPPPDGGMPMP